MPTIFSGNEMPSFRFEGWRVQNSFVTTRKMFYLTFIDKKRPGWQIKPFFTIAARKKRRKVQLKRALKGQIWIITGKDSDPSSLSRFQSNFPPKLVRQQKFPHHSDNPIIARLAIAQLWLATKINVAALKLMHINFPFAGQLEKVPRNKSSLTAFRSWPRKRTAEQRRNAQNIILQQSLVRV